MAVYWPKDVIGWSYVAQFYGLLKNGSRDKASLSIAVIESFRGMLNKSGFNAGTPDGIFGAKTEAAVRAMQGQLSAWVPPVAVDGIVGPATWNAYFHTGWLNGKAVSEA